MDFTQNMNVDSTKRQRESPKAESSSGGRPAGVEDEHGQRVRCGEDAVAPIRSGHRYSRAS